jgi:Leucine-rich repeat (LRR) protein
VSMSPGGTVSGGANDPDKHRLEAELRRARDALETLNRQLLEERGQRERERREEEEQKALELEERAAREVEDEARRRRAREDERKIAAGEDIKTFTIRFMDGTRKKIDAFLSDSIGEIINRVCAKVGIRYTDMLHLAHSVNENSVLGAVDRFLDKQKTLEQENITPKSNLVFKFKHYKRLRRWNDSTAQEWFFRQLHHNVVTEYYPASEKLSVELAGLEIQSIFGDASGKKRHSYFDRVGLDSYLPVSVSAHDYDYWQERLYAAHKRRRGLSAIDARQRFIDTFSAKSPYWGMTFFDVRDRENRPFLAGVAEDGLYILSAAKQHILRVLSFDYLAGWERSATGFFVKQRNSSKMTLFATSKLQSKEIVDLLNEYYMMLPQDVRDRLNIAVENHEELRAKLPPPELFEPTIVARRKPVEFASRLEYFKHAYMEQCLQAATSDKNRRQPITKLTQAIDKALDEDKDLEDFDLSNCDPPIDDWQFASVAEVLEYVKTQVNAVDPEQWKDNLRLKKINIAHTNGGKITDRSIANLCNIIRHFSTSLTHLNLSYVPLDGRNESDLGAALGILKNLEVLVLRGCKISQKGFKDILHVFSIVPSLLNTLDLEHNNLTHAAVGAICGVMEGENCSLTSLNLGYNLIEIVGLESLIATLKRKPKKLRVLDFSGNPGGRNATTKFAELISASVGIVDLNLSQLAIAGDAGVRVTQELKIRSEITKLNLSDNPIGKTLTRQRHAGTGEVSRDYPAEFFAFLDVGSNSAMKELILDRVYLSEDAGQALASVLHNNTKLTELIVSNNELAAKTGMLAPAWVDMIAANQYVTKLNIAYNGITYAGIMKLFSAMLRNRSIAELTLDGNAVDRYPPNAPHTELVTFLENNTSVTVLSMCNMQIKDDVLLKMGEGMRRNRGLKRLIAHHNEVTVRGVSEVARHLTENSTLEFLDLSCKSVQASDEVYLQAYKTLIETSNVETILL